MKTTQELRSLKFPKKYSAETMLKMLLQEDIPTNKICPVRPVDITKSATYISIG